MIIWFYIASDWLHYFCIQNWDSENEKSSQEKKQNQL